MYIRAAIEHATGIRLPLERVRELLVEEGLITKAQAQKHATIFRGYAEFYEYNDDGDSQEENQLQEEDFKQVLIQEDEFEKQQDLRRWQGLGKTDV